MVKYGVHLYLWTERFDESALPLIAKVKGMGFDGVEIPMVEPEVINMQKAKRELQRSGIECIGSVGLTPDRDLASSEEAVRRRGVSYLKRCAELVAELGGNSMNGVIYTAWGKFTGKNRTEDEWRHSVEGLKEACQHARTCGVTLGLEVVNRFETYFLNTAADAVKLVKDVGEPNIGVHLDTFHMNIEEKDFYTPIKETGNLLCYFHCCENDRGVPGTGHVDWERTFQALSEIGYDGWLVVESFAPDMKKEAIWRMLAPSADVIASDGLKFVRKMSKKYAAR